MPYYRHITLLSICTVRKSYTRLFRPLFLHKLIEHPDHRLFDRNVQGIGDRDRKAETQRMAKSKESILYEMHLRASSLKIERCQS